MVPDIYFDCPLCAHTVMVEPSLVGKLVECPDCGGEIRVPDIRDGVNPRYRSQDASSPAAPAPTPVTRGAAAGLEADVDLLEENLAHLLRRREEQARQLEYIRFNAELCVKQIRLLKSQSGEAAAPPAAATPSAPSAVSPAAATPLTRWSMTLAAVTIAAGFALLLALLLPRG